MAKKKKKKKQHRFFWFMIKFQIFLMIIVLGGLGYYFFGGYAGQVQKLRGEAVELVKQSDKNTFVPVGPACSTIRMVRLYLRQHLKKTQNMLNMRIYRQTLLRLWLVLRIKSFTVIMV